MEQEIWKDVIGYEGLYKISNYGIVKSLPRNGCGSKEKIISKQLNNCGYMTVLLNKANIRKRHLVHRIIAFAFIPNEFNKPDINHIDGNKANNNINNLEWVTKSENVIHSMKNGLKKDYGIGREVTEEHRSNLSKSLKGRKSPCGFKGKKRSEEAINKFKQSMKERKNEKF